MSSKKDAEVRRRELLGSGKGSLAAELASLCVEHAGGLLVCPKGCDILAEVATGAEAGAAPMLLSIPNPSSASIAQHLCLWKIAEVSAICQEPCFALKGCCWMRVRKFLRPHRMRSLRQPGSSLKASVKAMKVCILLDY